MEAESKGEILCRLKIVEGHMHGIVRMVEEDRHSMDIIQQTCAVKRAIGKVSRLLLEHHLECCLRRALCEGDPEIRRQALEEVLAILQPRVTTVARWRCKSRRVSMAAADKEVRRTCPAAN